VCKHGVCELVNVCVHVHMSMRFVSMFACVLTQASAPAASPMLEEV